MRALEGWLGSVTPVPPLTLRRVARAVGRGGERALTPTWPEGPKEGSRRPALRGCPWRPASCGRVLRRLAVSGSARGAIPVRWPAPARRAPRALEDVRKALTARNSQGTARQGDGKTRSPLDGNRQD
jgi:hypothetical protein